MQKVHKTNYSNYTGKAMKIYVATMEVLNKKDKHDET
jgi:hypothetical protein